MTMSVGRDYAAGYSNSYEYVIFNGETVIARKGGFKSAATARRHALRQHRNSQHDPRQVPDRPRKASGALRMITYIIARLFPNTPAHEFDA